MNKIKIICTLGPSSLKKKIITQLKKEKVDLMRINLSHTNTKIIQKKINFLKRNNVNNICIDTEGAQIRTSYIKNEIFLQKNNTVKFICSENKSNEKTICVHPTFKFNLIKLNTTIDIGFSNLTLKVQKKSKDKKSLICKVTKPGFLGSNKGVHIDAKIDLPPLTKKDIYALKLMKKNKIHTVAISFVNKSSDVSHVRKLIGKHSFLISKIETKNAIKDLKNISKVSNALLIDRGDLSREIPIEDIPFAQEYILNHSLKYKTPAYVATNLLETMIKENLPTRAESHDIYSSLKQGAKGMVLAAETAIGKDPLNCVRFLKKCIYSFKYKKKFI